MAMKSFKEGTLSSVFSFTEEEQEAQYQKRIKKIIDRVSKSSPLGRKIVNSALSKGVVIEMEQGDNNVNGRYVPSMKCVFLNAYVPDDVLLATIVHECRHSEQSLDYGHTYSVHSAVSIVRALEADAMAHECAAVYQMRKTEPETYDAFCFRHEKVMKAYEQSFETEKDENKAKEEAFKAWYDHQEYVEQYDAHTVDYMAMGKLYAGAYKKEVSSKDFLNDIGYVNPDFFNSARANTVSHDVAKGAEKVERSHIRHLLKFDKSNIKTSAEKFFVRSQSGQIETCGGKNVLNVKMINNKMAGR